MNTVTAYMLASLCVAGITTAACIAQAQATQPSESQFIAAKLSAYHSPHPISRREAIMDVWGLSEADIAQPVKLFKE